MADIHDPACSRVDLLYFQILVEHDDAIGSVIDDGIGKALGFLGQEGQAHIDIGFPLVHSNGLFTASVVTTGTAVELLLRGELSGFLEDLLDLPFPRHLAVQADEAVIFDQVCLGRLLHCKVLLTGVPVDSNGIRHRTAAFTLHSRAAHTAARADGHFDKALFQTAFFDVIQCGNAVVDAIHH